MEVFEVSEECPPQQTLDAASLRCRGCSACGPHSHRTRECDSRRDTACQCNRGYYDDDLNGCRACELCPHGWGAHRPCSPHSNAVCRRCARGSFSNVLSSTLGCFPCAVCRKHQLLRHNCTDIHDTVCVDSVRPKLSSSSAPPHLELVSVGSDGHSVWPIYSALLLTLVLACLAYLLLKRWKMSSAAAPHTQLMPEAERTRPPAIISSTAAFAGQHVYRDICRSRRRLLEATLDNTLDGNGNWRDLALALGYSRSRLLALESPDKSSHSRRLLNDWSATHPTPTLQSLQRALRAVGRVELQQLLSAPPLCLCAQPNLCSTPRTTTTHLLLL